MKAKNHFIKIGIIILLSSVSIILVNLVFHFAIDPEVEIFNIKEYFVCLSAPITLYALSPKSYNDKKRIIYISVFFPLIFTIISNINPELFA